VFGTYLYTSNGATQTITNGIDLAGKGGLVWAKTRSGGTASDDHWVTDTNIYTKYIRPNTTDSYSNSTSIITAFNSDGYSLGSNVRSNTSGATYASWTFRKQPKFFDAVTYTGTGSAHTIAHSLGSVPGCIMVKDLTNLGNWQVYHNGLTSAAYSIQLNLTAAQASATTVWNSTAPTASVFSVGTSTDVNNSGDQYIAYIFAHNAGGFGLTGTDNVISCGSFTYNATSGTTVNLGYEPQFVIGKVITDITQWAIADTMRGMPAPPSGGLGCAQIYANLAIAESNGSTWYRPTSTGFYVDPSFANTGDTFIYIAIRRGPMKVPTDATKVFAPVTYTGDGSTGVNINFTVGFPIDMQMLTLSNQDQTVDSSNGTKNTISRLTGLNTTSTRTVSTRGLFTSTTNKEFNISGYVNFLQNTFGVHGDNGNLNIGTYQYGTLNFKRAPKFFDEVCYTGDGGSVGYVNHNLTIAPQLWIVKRISAAGTNWAVGSTQMLASQSMALNTTNSSTDIFSVGFWASTYPDTTKLYLGGNVNVNSNGVTYVAYLFATCAGVSKVGSYTGNGTTQTIDCGFAGGVRFVLIKRTDASGGWYMYDTARGMTTLTDPYLLTNSAYAQVATLGSVVTVTTGFSVDSSVLAAINVNAGTYIFLAVA
jgi:hypothetical protein